VHFLHYDVAHQPSCKPDECGLPAAEDLVSSHCKRGSGNKVVEEALFGCRIFKLNVAPFRAITRQNRLSVKNSVTPVTGADEPTDAPALVGHSLRRQRCELIAFQISGAWIDGNSEIPEPSISRRCNKATPGRMRISRQEVPAIWNNGPERYVSFPRVCSRYIGCCGYEGERRRGGTRSASRQVQAVRRTVS
jgi:hypothetical protein